MANSYITYTGNGVLQTFNVPFPYISQSEVACQINGVATTFTWPTSSSITLATIPGNGANVYIYRTTAITLPDVVWSDGTTIRAADLNLEVQQLLYGLQDTQDQAAAAIIAALAKTSQLPPVGTPQNNDFLGVVAGAWSVVTPTAMATALGLGSAAFVSTGTGPTQVPLNSSLGTAAYVATGTGASQVPLNSSLGTLAYLNILAGGGIAAVGSTLYTRGVQVVSSDPVSPVEGDKWYRSDIHGFKSYESATIIADSHVLSRTVTDSTAIANTAAMTACSQGIAIPANFLTTGKVLRMRFSAWYSSVSSPSLIVITGIDTTSTLLDGTSFTAGSTGRVHVDLILTCRSTGTSGSISVSSVFLSNGMPVVLGDTETTYTLNTTISHTVVPCAQWGTASASNTISFRSLICEVLDP